MSLTVFFIENFNPGIKGIKMSKNDK